MFRYERPQKGRYRQFHQIGVETFGMAGADIDAELIMVSARIWKELGLLDSVTLQLNSLGSNEARAVYREALVVYLRQHIEQLDDDSRRRLDSNPLRILDSKNEQTQALLKDAPVLTDYLDAESRRDFEELRSILDSAGIAYELNPRLVRGLDYYCKTVFEWVTDKLGSQGTVCAGGRYDGLVKQLGGRPTSAVGFAMGIERLILMLETLELLPAEVHALPDLFVAAEHKGLQSEVLGIAEKIREALPGLRVMGYCGGLKNINNKGRQTGARLILLLRESEGGVLLTLWDGDAPPQRLNVNEVIPLLADKIER
jgi:histidyl-tRNA synthetase